MTFQVPPDLNDPIILAKLTSLHRLGQMWCPDEDFEVLHENDKDWAAKEVKKNRHTFADVCGTRRFA